MNDYDVLGIGAVRRGDIEADFEADARRPLLQLHRGLVSPSGVEIYNRLLEQTSKWLRPIQVADVKFLGSAEDYVYFLLFKEFEKSFPLTFLELRNTGVEKFLRGYLSEFPWQGPLLTEHLRYVPIYVAQQFQDSRRSIVAQKEWLRSYLRFADFGSVRSELGRVTLNPSLQILHAPIDVPEIKLSRGVYIFYYDEAAKKVRDHKLEKADAAVVDALQDDRKYTLDQLIEQVLLMEDVKGLTRLTLRNKVFFLAEQGILKVSDSKIL